MTLYRILATNSGMTASETAAFLQLPPSTSAAYWYAKRTARRRDLIKLHALDRRITSIASRLIAGLTEMLSDAASKPHSIKLKRIKTDQAARAYRLPYASCHEAAIGRVLRNLPAWALSRVEFTEDGEDVEIS